VTRQQLADLGQQSLAERRIEKNDVESDRGPSLQIFTGIGALDDSLDSLQPIERHSYMPGHARVAIDEHRPRRAA